MLAIRAVQLRVSSLPAVFSRSVTTVLTPLEKKYFPHLGNREIVGYGRSGVPNYCDDMACPYPAIRFRNHDEAVGKIDRILEIKFPCRSKLFVRKKKVHGVN